jgi:hypothetical protein
MLMPDFVLSLALWLQEYGLKSIPQSREQPMLDPETLWRVPPDINVVAIPPPARKIDSDSIAVLNAHHGGGAGFWIGNGGIALGAADKLMITGNAAGLAAKHPVGPSGVHQDDRQQEQRADQKKGLLGTRKRRGRIR